jgi:protein-L-isoaspartate(D-aspartate) O-methyltransferase
MADSRDERREMVARQIVRRGVRSPAVARAMREVPRELFTKEELREFAYSDAPLPIGEGQTISQPYIVAYMTEALELEGGERVLEVGTGSGYAAAVLSRLAGEVYTIERYESLAAEARAALARAGYGNVHVIVGDGTKGWPAGAPYDAIVVAAGGPQVPSALREQLAVGGRLVMPVGDTPREQHLVRVHRMDEERYEDEELLPVRFVPLIGEQGWPAEKRPAARVARAPRRLPQLIADAAEPFSSIDQAPLEALLRRIGDARIVLLGEASHGSAEFYRMRAHVTQELVERKHFNIVAVEADWPDAGRIDHYVRHRDTPAAQWKAFTRFPEWMWRNTEVQAFVDWLHRYNMNRPYEERVGFHGLDLYSLNTSIRAVLAYLDEVDPEAAGVARSRYGCLTPWESDPATYGRMALSGRYRACERDVAAMLTEMLKKRLEYSQHDGERFFDAAQNARVVADAERYYRVMYYGSAESWNLRDRHMFDTLQELLKWGGERAKAVVWAHNSHLGDARYTEMSARGELNIGQLVREKYGENCYAVGFGTDRGTVAAADDWDGPLRVKEVRPSHAESYERQCRESGAASFLLALRPEGELRRRLMEPRLERAIGVIYRPQTELASHYFQAVLPRQFDDYCWFERTSAVTPLDSARMRGMPETYPFGV